ncbi:helix-turn-helix domain-containing protein [Reichenbachiella agariperforans]|uniref:helix-turn-helix domain-containing protein n=1 Tax=Reichenbachiella agariperforans TaxID=156994 RepID=UPI001C091B36|nr:helix-turn-helix domain-containing protein [Reichenbachiella agariperforans]MBU2915953.1 helix-turn-helix domain-containing protein [Reichenbachiella agariperforans]
MTTNDLLTKQDLADFEKRVNDKLQQALAYSEKATTKKWLRSKEVAKMLGISTSSLQNFRINGTLPFIKLDGTILYDYDEIMAVMKANQVRA